MIRNFREDQDMLREGLGGMEEEQGRPSQDGAQTKSTSSLFRSLGAVCVKLVVQVTYGLEFGRSLYV